MSLKKRVALFLYSYHSELGIGILSLSFGVWALKNSSIVVIHPVTVKLLAVGLILVGGARIAGAVFRSNRIRETAANISILLWASFFSIALYISSDLWIIFLALLMDALIVRISQIIRHKVINGEY